MEELILNNINLIYLALKKYKLYEVRDEYFDVGMIGLVKAAKTYSEKTGIAFSTYAMHCIENEIKHTRRKEFALKRGAGQINISLSSMISIGNDETELIDIISNKFNLEEYIIQNELYKKLYKEIDDLPEKNKFIICSIFELKDYKRLTQQELSKKLNISQSQVCRILKKTIERLRDKLGGD